MINYARLDRSVAHYANAGFIRTEVPWTVTKAVSDITRPPLAKEFILMNRDKVLVASGEQGFLYLALKGYLAPGMLQAITPCFRDEPFDATHTKYFMKNELIVTGEAVNETTLEATINSAAMFFETELQRRIDRVKTADGWDLEVCGMELGSYGIRTTSFLTWIYGTGVAEPRMTMVSEILARSY